MRNAIEPQDHHTPGLECHVAHEAGLTSLDRMFADAPEKFGVDEAAELLGVNPRTISNWLRDNQLPGYKLPGKWLILREELREYMLSIWTGFPADSAKEDV